MFSGELYTTPHHTVCLVSSIVVARVIPCKSWSDRATNKPFLIDWKQTEFEFKIIPRNDLNNKSIIDKNGNFFMIITGIRWDFRNNYGFNPKIQIYLSSLLPHFGKFWGYLTFLSHLGIYRPFYNHLWYHSRGPSFQYKLLQSPSVWSSIIVPINPAKYGKYIMEDLRW